MYMQSRRDAEPLNDIQDDSVVTIRLAVPSTGT